MRDGLLEGLALIHRFEPEVVRELAMRLPVVSLTHFVPGVRADLVDSDHIGAIAKLVDRLHEHGHRRIGFIGRAPNLSYSQARFGSFCQSMARLGLEVDPAASVNVTKEISDLDRQADVVATLIRKRGYTAFVCASDLVGYQVCRGLMDRGVRVPQDVSLTGFDALDPLYDCPAMTSVRVPFADLGVFAMTRLIMRIQRPALPALKTLFDCELVEGETTGRVS